MAGKTTKLLVFPSVEMNAHSSHSQNPPTLLLHHLITYLPSSTPPTTYLHTVDLRTHPAHAPGVLILIRSNATLKAKVTRITITVSYRSHRIAFCLSYPIYPSPAISSPHRRRLLFSIVPPSRRIALRRLLTALHCTAPHPAAPYQTIYPDYSRLGYAKQPERSPSS